MSELVSKELVVLGGQIRSAWAAAQKAGRDAMDRAYVVGEKLNAAQAKVPRGEWGKYLKEHCPEISERTAQVYMRVVSNWEYIPDDCTTIVEATRAISILGSQSAVSAQNPPADGGFDEGPDEVEEVGEEEDCQKPADPKAKVKSLMARVCRFEDDLADLAAEHKPRSPNWQRALTSLEAIRKALETLAR